MDLDSLYGLPPEEFTPARDALARELRAAGDKDGAANVKALRKPTVAAWAINQAARSRPEELEELLAAAANLRRAHERLLAGEGDRSVLREASEHERAAVAAMARAAAELAADAGRPLSDAMVDRVRQTLHAATLDDGVREAVEHGRLEREAEAAGGAFGMAAAAMPAVAGRKAAAAPKPKERDREAEAQRKAALAEAEAAAREADRAVREAERETEKRLADVDRAQRAVDIAEERLQAARADLDEAGGEAESARARLRAAKEAAAAAHARVTELD